MIIPHGGLSEYQKARLEASIKWFRGQRDGKYLDISRDDFIVCEVTGKSFIMRNALPTIKNLPYSKV